MRSWFIRIGTPWLAALALAVTPVVSRAQEPSLMDVLVRATEYVDTLLGQLSDTVSEERYEQRWRLPTGQDRESVKRVLVSDYSIVTPEGAKRPYGFRDVFEVDGRPVRDRAERLSKLFLNSSIRSDRQIQEILRESARHNLGDVDRTINTPTLALIFLSANDKSRCAFERVSDTSPRLKMDRSDMAADAWVLAYKETWPTTIIVGRGGRNMPAEGRFWIKPATGRVLMSELIVRDTGELTIAVRYDEDERLGHSVPVEMRERYQPQRGSYARVDGKATYTSFRQFQVHVEESRD